MEHIKDTLKGVIKTITEKDTNAHGDTSIESVWPQCVGEKIAQETRPYFFRDGLLRVYVSSSVWVFELTHKYKVVIKDRLNETLGENTVKDIYFRIGTL